MRQPKLIVALAFIVLAAAAVAKAVEFIPLGFVPGTNYGKATDISADGSTVVGLNASTTGSDGSFRWTHADGIKPLPELPGGPVASQAFGVSRDGSVMVGYSFSSNGAEAVRWPASGGVTALGDLPGGIFDANAIGVSGDGSIIVGRGSNNAGFDTFRWTAATGMQSIGVPAQSIPSRISDDGKVIVGRQSPNFQSQLPTAFMWTQAGGTEFIGDLPGGILFSAANGVSADGSTIVGVSSSARAPNGEPFRWTRSTGMQPLPNTPAPFASHAYDVSGDGSVIVGYAAYAGDQQAFVWDEVNGLRDIKTLLSASGIDMGGWSLREATAISDDGKIITGWGVDPAGRTQPWVAVIPEPGSFLIIFLGAAPILSCKKRCR